MTTEAPRLSRAQESALNALSRIEPATPKALAQAIYGTKDSLRTGWTKNTLQALQHKGLVTSEDAGFDGRNAVLVWRTAKGA